MPAALAKDWDYAAKVVLEKERREFAKDFGKFFRAAWSESIEPTIPLTESWHYDLECEYAQLIGSGEFKKRFPDKKGLIFNVPPRTLKSSVFNIALPPWVWTFAPGKRFLCISYGQTLAVPFSVRRRDLLRSKWYQAHWPKVKVKDDADNKDNYANSKGGYMVCGSPGSIATGFGGNIIIIDDLLKADDAYSSVTRNNANEFYENSLSSRRNNPAEDVYLIVCQRLHEDDIVGHLLKKEPDEWLHVKIPLECEQETQYDFPVSGRVFVRQPGEILLPSRFTAKFVQGEKRRPRVWSGQYQQIPSPPGGYIYDPEQWRYYDKAPDPDFQILSVDCAWRSTAQNDKVALHVYGIEGPDKFLLHRDTSHKSYNQTIDAIRRTRQLFPKISYVLVENRANGSAVIRQLQDEMAGLIPIDPEGGKESRAVASSADLASGNCYVPNPETHTWVQREWIDTFAAYNGEGSIEHDDDIDAFSQAVNWVRRQFHGNFTTFYDGKAKQDQQQQGERGSAKSGKEETTKGFRF